ncbi:MAG: AAA family ATPase [Nanoarchaeota archaeon]|nr:AAA family ATPase [Nanoarchaeota archaeon]
MVRKSNVLAVMSPKGGVGKTVTTANLAAALASQFNKKILAIDTNVSTASLGLHLNMFYPKTSINDISNKKKFSVEEIIYPYSENLHIIPASIKIKKKDRNLNKMRENVQKIINNYDKLLKDVSKKYDLILLDCAPGFDIEAIATMHVAGGLLLVTNPEYPAIVTAVKAIEYAKSLKMPVGGIVLNKVNNKKYEITKEEIEDALRVNVIGKIPFDKKMSQSISESIPLVLFRPRSKASKAYKKLAAKLSGEKEDKRFWSKFKKTLKFGK